MKIFILSFIILLVLYMLPVAIIVVLSIIGGIESLIPNKITRKICNYVGSKSDKIETLLEKFYPFLR